MRYEIDQSGKIEQTNKDTVVAIKNNYSYSILLKSKDKRWLKGYFKDKKKTKRYPYAIFSILVAYCIYALSPKEKVVIDQEYFGHENTIQTEIMVVLKSLGYSKKVHLEFSLIGKSSPAHKLSSQVVKKLKKPDEVVSLKGIIQYLRK